MSRSPLHCARCDPLLARLRRFLAASFGSTLRRVALCVRACVCSTVVCLLLSCAKRSGSLFRSSESGGRSAEEEGAGRSPNRGGARDSHQPPTIGSCSAPLLSSPPLSARILFSCLPPRRTLQFDSPSSGEEEEDGSDATIGNDAESPRAPAHDAGGSSPPPGARSRDRFAGRAQLQLHASSRIASRHSSGARGTHSYSLSRSSQIDHESTSMARPMRDGEELLREIAKRMQPNSSASPFAAAAPASAARQNAPQRVAAAPASKPEVIALSSDDEEEITTHTQTQPRRDPISMPLSCMRSSAAAAGVAPAAAASSSAAASAASSFDRLSAAASSIVPAASAISLDSDDSGGEEWGIVEDDEDAFERAMVERKPPAPDPAARAKEASIRLEEAKRIAAQADQAVFSAFAFSDDEEEDAPAGSQAKPGPGRPRGSSTSKPAAAAASSCASPAALLALAQSQQLARMSAHRSQAQDELMAMQLAMTINASPDLAMAEPAGRLAGSAWAARKSLDKIRRNITAWQKQDAPAPMSMARLGVPQPPGVAPEAGVTRSGLKRLRRPANASDTASDSGSSSGSGSEEEEDADGTTREDRIRMARAAKRAAAEAAAEARAAAAEDSAAQKEQALAALLDETKAFLSNIKQIAPSLLQQTAAAAMEPAAVASAPVASAAAAAADRTVSPTLDDDDAQLDDASAAAASSSSAAATSSSSSAAASPDASAASASRPRIEPSVAASAFCPLLTAPGALLKGYQISGITWLQSLYKLSLSGGILADEMGLGKTVQTVCFLAWILYEDRESDSERQKQQAMEQTIDLCDDEDTTAATTAAPAAVVAAPPRASPQYHPAHLVLVPLSTLSAWQLAFAHWCPSLRVHTHYSLDKDDRKRALKAAVRARGKMTVHVVLSTYDLFLKDSSAFLHFPWRCLVIDEATRLKNSETVFFQLIKELRARFRLLLTGTPLSNKLSDLFSLLHFIAPSQFDNLQAVEEMFSGVANETIEPNSTAAAAAASLQQSEELDAAASAATDAGTLLSHLHAVIRPFLLRRTKERVLPLPPYLERFVPVPLSGHQQAMYKAIQRKGRQTTGNGSSTTVKSFQNLLMQLRKISASPFLFKADYIEELWADADRLLAAAGSRPSSSLGIHEPNRLPPRVLRQLMESQKELISTSGKFWTLHNILPKLLYREASLPTDAAVATGVAGAVPPSLPKHKLLIFSTFRIVLDQVAVYLDLFHGAQSALPLRYLQMDGTTPAAEREEMIAEFNAPDSEFCIFLLTTRAGGLGVNLQSASTVLLLDADWNPSADLQAIARAHRLGQSKQVLVLRMVAPGVEEYIMKTARAKSEVEGRVIAGGQFSEEHVLHNSGTAPLDAHIAKERARLLQAVFQQDLADASSDLIAVNDTQDDAAANTTATQKPLRSSAATSIAGLNLNKLLARDAAELELFEQMDRDAAAAATGAVASNSRPVAPATPVTPLVQAALAMQDEDDDDLQVLDSKIVRTGSSSSSSSSSAVAAAAAASAPSASTTAASLSPASFGPVSLQTAVEFPRWFAECTTAAPTHLAPATSVELFDDDVAIVTPVSVADAAASASPAIASLLRGRSCKTKRSYTELRDSAPFSADGESSVAEQAQLKRALKLSSATAAPPKKPRGQPPPRKSHLSVEGESDEEDEQTARKPQRAPARPVVEEQFSCACGALFDDFSDLQVHTLCSCSLTATS